MSEHEETLPSRVALLERRVKSLSMLLGILGLLTVTLAFVGGWQAYRAREVRKDHDFWTRRLLQLGAKVDASSANHAHRIASLERRWASMRDEVKSVQMPTVRRWFLRTDRHIMENERRIERLEGTIESLKER